MVEMERERESVGEEGVVEGIVDGVCDEGYVGHLRKKRDWEMKKGRKQREKEVKMERFSSGFFCWKKMKNIFLNTMKRRSRERTNFLSNS